MTRIKILVCLRAAIIASYVAIAIIIISSWSSEAIIIASLIPRLYLLPEQLLTSTKMECAPLSSVCVSSLPEHVCKVTSVVICFCILNVAISPQECTRNDPRKLKNPKIIWEGVSCPQTPLVGALRAHQYLPDQTFFAS